MLTSDDMQAILRQLSYPNMSFGLIWRNDMPCLQLTCRGTCNVTGLSKTWKSRKWLLSYHMTKSELVQTALKAVLTAVEHEAREQFKYLGQAVFGPHFDVEIMAAVAANPKTRDERT